MTNTSIFLSLAEDFVGNFLPVGKGASPNTIKSYKYAFRLLIEFMFSEKNIPADRIQFSDLDYTTLLSFFEWITTKRKCSTTTRNQRLAALMSFSEYAQNRNFDAASTVLLRSLPRKHNKETAHGLMHRRFRYFLLCQMTVLPLVYVTKCCFVLCMRPELVLKRYAI